MTENNLLDNGFKLIGVKDNGLKVYARRTAIDDSNIVLHKVNGDGESLGVEFIEVETVKILMGSDLL